MMQQAANLTIISVSCCFYSGELIKDLNSSDEVTQQNALKAANGYIAVSDEHCRTKVNTTRINTNPPDSACQVNTCTQSHPVQHKSNHSCAVMAILPWKVHPLYLHLQTLQSDDPGE